jgi:hypothetical protein
VTRPPPAALPVVLPGLYVHLGRRDAAGKWIQRPVAEFRCRFGCEYGTAGPTEVAAFCARIDVYHGRTCPGRAAAREAA